MTAATDDTRPALLASTGVALLMVGQLVVSRALRDGFFLTHYEATALPWMMMAAAALSVAVVLGSSHLLRSVAPAHSLPVILAVSAGLFVVEWWLARSVPRTAAVAVYLHVMSVSAVAFSGFWSVVNERFDPYRAKQLMPRITGGATLGGVAGGVAAWWGAGVVEIPTMILIVGGLNAACALGVVAIGPGRHEPGRAEAATGSAFQVMRETPYLQQLLTLVVLVAFAQAVYDYVFKAAAATRYAESAELVSFFALFYMALNVVTLVVQQGVAGIVLRRFGLSATTGALPASGVVLGAASLLAPGLATAAAARGGVGVMENSLYRSGYELLYTPVLPEKKRPTKALIDVGGDKLGTALGGGAAMVALAMAPALSSPALVVVGIGAGLAGLWVTRRLHHGYVASLAERLRAGEIGAHEVEIVDATTEMTLVQALGTLGRDGDAAAESSLGGDADGEAGIGRTELIDRLSMSATLSTGDRVAAPGDAGSANGAGAAPTGAPLRPAPPPALPDGPLDEIAAAAAQLRSGEPERIRAVLRGMPRLAPELVALAIPLVDEGGVGDLVMESLRRVAPAHVGTLIDAALDPRHPVGVRRRMCDLLGRVPTQRCAAGLAEMLADPDFELRFRAASSLLRVRRANGAIGLDAARLFAVAEREAADALRRWRARIALDPRVSPETPLESAAGRRVLQSASLIWSLLLCVLERDGLVLAIRALGSESPAQRGTGLEYLEQVLPDRLFASLKPLLDDERLALGGARTRGSVLEEVVAARRGETQDLGSLRARVEALRTGGHPAPQR